MVSLNVAKASFSIFTPSHPPCLLRCFDRKVSDKPGKSRSGIKKVKIWCVRSSIIGCLRKTPLPLRERVWVRVILYHSHLRMLFQIILRTLSTSFNTSPFLKLRANVIFIDFDEVSPPLFFSPPERIGIFNSQGGEG